MASTLAVIESSLDFMSIFSTVHLSLGILVSTLAPEWPCDLVVMQQHRFCYQLVLVALLVEGK